MATIKISEFIDALKACEQNEELVPLPYKPN
jgi:hypothetical protein